jgi:hypothetical protein
MPLNRLFRAHDLSGQLGNSHIGGWTSRFNVMAQASWNATDSDNVPTKSADTPILQTTGIANDATAAYRTFIVGVAHPVAAYWKLICCSGFPTGSAGLWWRRT